jgi:NAD(P) transhydrogenase subunit alpha
MSQEYQAKQAALLAETLKKQDMVITTALIPGRPAPVLISKEMVASMKPGSVIVDLAVENGGNCEMSQPGKVVTTPNGVTVVGHLNVPGRLAADASALYARNLFNFVELLVDKEAKALAIDWDDEIVQGTLIARDGAVVHPAVAEAAPKPKAKSKPKAKPAEADEAPGSDATPGSDDTDTTEAKPDGEGG